METNLTTRIIVFARDKLHFKHIYLNTPIKVLLKWYNLLLITRNKSFNLFMRLYG